MLEFWTCQHYIVRSWHDLENKKVPHVGEVLYTMSSQWCLAFQYNWWVTRENTESGVSPANGMRSINPTLWWGMRPPKVQELMWQFPLGNPLCSSLSPCLFYNPPRKKILQSCSSCFPLCISNIAVYRDIGAAGSLCRNPQFQAQFVLSVVVECNLCFL